MSAVICLENLCKSYGRKEVLHELNLELPRGGLFGFIGPNGAGKTTTIRLLLGMLRPNRGSALIFGQPAWQGNPLLRKRIGYLPGDLKLPPFYTVVEAARIAGLVFGKSLTEAYTHLADYFQLNPGVKVQDMSRGMRQKLGLIIALGHDPELLILDEPTTALDPLVQGTLVALLKERARRGTTIFFSSHILGEVADLCDQVGIIRAGRLVENQPLSILKGRATRHLSLTWNQPMSDLQPPACLTLAEHTDTHWNATLAGEAGPLLQWLEGKPVKDLTLGEQDLDQLFRTYYQEEHLD